MTRPIIDEAGVQREMTESEYSQWLFDNEQRAELAARQNEAQAIRTAAINKLKNLGLTDDEIAALVG